MKDHLYSTFMMPQSCGHAMTINVPWHAEHFSELLSLFLPTVFMVHNYREGGGHIDQAIMLLKVVAMQ